MVAACSLSPLSDIWGVQFVFMYLINLSHNYLCLVPYLHFTGKIAEVQGLEGSFCKEDYIL